MEQSPNSILKLGGSLLDLADLKVRLEKILTQYPQSGIVVGGGKIADCIRDFQSQHALSEATAHAIAIQSMGITENLIARMLQLRVARSVVELRQAWKSGHSAIINAESMLQDNSVTWPAFPETWETSSDSIAAAFAHGLGTPLVLLKSVDQPDMPWQQASEQQFVDTFFPTLAGGLKIQWINVREYRADA